jgi:hypothetical protein
MGRAWPGVGQETGWRRPGHASKRQQWCQSAAAYLGLRDFARHSGGHIVEGLTLSAFGLSPRLARVGIVVFVLPLLYLLRTTLRLTAMEVLPP